MSSIHDDIKISALSEGNMNGNSAFVTDDLISGEYETQYHLLSEIASKFLNSFAYTQNLDTTSKLILGALLELSARITTKQISGVLAAGQTSVTISDNRITTNSVIDYWGKTKPVGVSSSSGSITLTFEEMEEDYSFVLEVT